jgi:hypothetical protein
MLVNTLKLIFNIISRTFSVPCGFLSGLNKTTLVQSSTGVPTDILKTTFCMQTKLNLVEPVCLQFI